MTPGMVLSDRHIREEIDRGRLIVSPLGEDSLQPASIDIHLERKLLVFKTWHHPFYIDVRKSNQELTESLEIGDDSPFLLPSGEFVLASTVEYFALPDDIVGRLEGKSSLGRIGLLIHSTAGYIDPGFRGHLTLELSNVAKLPITLYPQMKIGQVSFLRLSSKVDRLYGSEGLGSKYQDQMEPTPTRFYEDFKES
jgi:dCTP deaminase